MFTIKVVKKNQLFTHLKGKSFPIAFSSWSVCVYPCRLVFEDLLSNTRQTLDLFLKGPIKNFTVLQNLEKNRIEVFGISEEGYFKYFIFSEKRRIVLQMIKTPKTGISYQLADKNEKLSAKEEISFPIALHTFAESDEKLSFGIHKQQQMEKITEREDLLEILPIWFALAQKMPIVKKKETGCLSLLGECKKLIDEKKRTEVFFQWKKIYLACFYDAFVPRLFDDDYQGICENTKLLPFPSPVHLVFSCGYELIRSMFIKQESNALFLLPCLPVECHCGRMLDLQCENIGSIDLEWSKKMIKRMIIRSVSDENVLLHFPSSIKRFRLRLHRKDRGRWVQSGQSIEMHGNKTYFLDRFQK